jgi:hypothetical protein
MMDGGARRWWRDAAILVAIVGLLVTGIFNTLEVRRQAGQAKRERVAVELGLLTQLSGLAREAEARLITLRDRVCKHRRRPTQANRMALIEAAEDYDYLAWLFNHDHLQMASARSYWAPSMIETYELFATIKIVDAQKRVPELRRFKLETPQSEWPPLEC